MFVPSTPAFPNLWTLHFHKPQVHTLHCSLLSSCKWPFSHRNKTHIFCSSRSTLSALHSSPQSSRKWKMYGSVIHEPLSSRHHYTYTTPPTKNKTQPAGMSYGDGRKKKKITRFSRQGVRVISYTEGSVPQTLLAALNIANVLIHCFQLSSKQWPHDIVTKAEEMSHMENIKNITFAHLCSSLLFVGLLCLDSLDSFFIFVLFLVQFPNLGSIKYIYPSMCHYSSPR